MTLRSTRDRIKIDLTRDRIKIHLRLGARGDAANAERRGCSTRRRSDRYGRGAGPLKDPRRAVRLQRGTHAAARGELGLFKFTLLLSHCFYFVL